MRSCPAVGINGTIVADVFVSYSRLDRALAEELARLLKSSGFDVWWDHDLLGTTSYRDQIKKKLAEASL